MKQSLSLDLVDDAVAVAFLVVRPRVLLPYTGSAPYALSAQAATSSVASPRLGDDPSVFGGDPSVSLALGRVGGSERWSVRVCMSVGVCLRARECELALAHKKQRPPRTLQ